MPFKCLTCGKLGSSEAIACDQSDKSQCHVRPVEVIHFAHAKGSGRKVARGQKQVAGPTGKDDKVIMEDLHLCCGSVAVRPMYSPAMHAVTCLSCIENAPTEPDTPAE